MRLYGFKPTFQNMNTFGQEANQIHNYHLSKAVFWQ